MPNWTDDEGYDWFNKVECPRCLCRFDASHDEQVPEHLCRGGLFKTKHVYHDGFSANVIEPVLIFYCDNQRHLVCKPYNVENLHKMAQVLNIKRCWFHSTKGHQHYDIPKRRVEEIKSKCLEVVTTRQILNICKSLV